MSDYFEYLYKPAKMVITELESLENLKATGGQVVLQFWPSTIRESRTVDYDMSEGFFKTSEPSFTGVKAREFRFTAYCRDNAYPEYGLGYTSHVLEFFRRMTEVGLSIESIDAFISENRPYDPRRDPVMKRYPTYPPGPERHKVTGFQAGRLAESPPRPLFVKAHDNFIGYLKSYSFSVETVDEDIITYPTSASIDLHFVEAIPRQKNSVLGSSKVFQWDNKNYIKF